MKSSIGIGTLLFLVALLSVPLAITSAQTVTTPYWCQSEQTGYWSSYPCGSYLPTGQAGNYDYSYVYSYPKMYSFSYRYPYSYTYPYFYNYPYYNYLYRYPTPSCTIMVTSSYSSSYYGYYGYSYLPAQAGNQPVTLSWSSSGASSAYISPNVGTVPTSGSRTVYPSANTTYTMTVQGPGGSSTCQTTYYQQYYSYYPHQYYQQYYYPYQYYQPYYYQYHYGYPNYNWI